MKKVFVCQTIKHIYTSIFASDYFTNNLYQISDFDKNVIVICSDHQNLNADTINVEFIRSLGMDVIFLDESELKKRFTHGSIFGNYNFIGNNIKVTVKGFEFVRTWLKKRLSHLFEGVDAVYLFHEKTFLSKYFLTLSNVSLLEDGFANYTRNKVRSSLLHKIMRLFLGLNPKYYYLGESKKIKQIYLFNRRDVPEAIRAKVRFISQDEFYVFNRYSRTDILNCFVRTRSDYQMEDYDFILLTQGLNIAKLSTKEEKTELYFSLIQIIVNSGFKLLVKLHPSESLSEYKNISFIENVDIIAEKIPVEALAHLVSSKTKVISLRSSAEISDLLHVINLVSDDKQWSDFDIDLIKIVSQKKLRLLL